MTNSGCPSTAMLGATPRPGPSGSVILPSFLTAPATVPVLTYLALVSSRGLELRALVSSSALADRVVAVEVRDGEAELGRHGVCQVQDGGRAARGG